MKKLILFLLCAFVFGSAGAQLPNWGNSLIDQVALRKFPCHEYEIKRTNSNQSIQSEVEYFDCYGNLRKFVVPAPTMQGEDTISVFFICSWSFPEANQHPLPEGGIPVVTQVIQHDGCFETYYRFPSGSGDYVPPATQWPSTPSLPSTPNRPFIPSPKKPCNNESFGFKIDHFNNGKTRIVIDLAPGTNVAITLTSKENTSSAPDFYASVPAWFDIFDDFGEQIDHSNYLGNTDYQDELNRVMTEERVDEDGYVMTNLDTAWSNISSENGGTYYIDITTPLGAGNMPDNREWIGSVFLKIQCY